MLSPSLNSGSSSLLRSYRSVFWAKQVVSAKRLDNLVEEQGINYIDLLKIDIEGYEFYALKSAQKLLEQKLIKYILIAYNDSQLKILGSSANEIKIYLESYGYIEKSYNDVYYFSSEN